MNRDQKKQAIAFLKHEFSSSQASFVVTYQGLTVNQVQQLRRELRTVGGTLKVAKARLMKIAAQGLSGVCDLSSYFKGQIGLVFVRDNAPAVAKVLHGFAKKNESLKINVGCMDSQLVNQQVITRLAQLPSREILLAQLCGTLKAPLTALVFVLSQVAQKGQGEAQQPALSE